MSGTRIGILGRQCAAVVAVCLLIAETLQAQDTHRPTFDRDSLKGKDANGGEWELAFVKKNSIESGRQIEIFEKPECSQGDKGELKVTATGEQERHVWAGASRDGKEVTLGGHGPVHMQKGYEYAAALLFEPKKSDTYELQGTLSINKQDQQKVRIQLGIVDRKGVYEEIAQKELEPGQYALAELFDLGKGVKLKSSEQLMISSYRSAYHWFHVTSLQDLVLVRK